AALRNILLSKGYGIEIISYFEPALDSFAKWWIQLFAESEGKDGKGLFPSSAVLTEDLHSMGQYIQQGPRHLFETFVDIQNPLDEFVLGEEAGDADEFNYVAGKDFNWMNRVALEATIAAHHSGGVPCNLIKAPALNAHTFGQLFYFFEYACFVSGALLGVNPFDQPGVEAYKRHMFQGLKQP
ncbi:MAG: glucose-6-phosphate isomerase, partial [bacterium]|nr:glucose-6-phosphate isomerase [bacterium]